MYLHLGQETLVNTKNIIGVFDLDTTTLSHKTREFLARAQREKQVVNVSEELPKSFVVTQEKTQTVYITQMAPATLKKRLENTEKIQFK